MLLLLLHRCSRTGLAIIAMAVIKRPTAENDHKPRYYRQRWRKQVGVGCKSSITALSLKWHLKVSSRSALLVRYFAEILHTNTVGSLGCLGFAVCPVYVYLYVMNSNCGISLKCFASYNLIDCFSPSNFHFGGVF